LGRKLIQERPGFDFEPRFTKGSYPAPLAGKGLALATVGGEGLEYLPSKTYR
jgi:hypothetical protein